MNRREQKMQDAAYLNCWKEFYMRQEQRVVIGWSETGTASDICALSDLVQRARLHNAARLSDESVSAGHDAVQLREAGVDECRVYSV